MGRSCFRFVICPIIIWMTFDLGFADDSPSAEVASRKTATWVLKNGGQLGVTTDGNPSHHVGKLSELPDGPFAIVQVDFGGQTRITDEDLKTLGPLAELEELNLSYTRVTDAGLKSLKSFPALKRLYLSETQITDEGVATLVQSSPLESLDLSGTRITDQHLTELKKLSKLSRLFLARTKLTGKAVDSLAGLSELAVLHLAGVELRPDEITQLGQLKKLTELSISTTDATLPLLDKLPQLKVLTVHGKAVTDRGMPALAKLSRLTQLRLSQTGVSETGVSLLESSLNDCRIMAYPISRQSAFLVSNGPQSRPVLRWQSGDPKDAWPGLIPQPASLPGLAHWQLETVEPRSEIRSVDFSPNGQRVACGTAAGCVRIYDANNLSLVALIPAHPRGVHAVAWSPDGTQLASAGADAMVRIWSAEGKPIRDLKGHRNSVLCVEWSPDGQQLATGSWDNTVRVWKVDGSESLEFQGHQKGVYAVAWNPEGQQIASGSHDKTIRLWDMAGKTLHTMEGHTDVVSSLAWNSRGSRLASGSWDHTIRFWNPRTGRGGPVLEGHTYRVFDLEWHPEGTMLASAGDRTLRLWTLDGTPVRTVKTEDAYVQTLSWKHDGTEIATGTPQNSVLRITSVEGNSDRAIGEDLNGGAVKIAWHPEGDRIAVGCRDRTTRFITADGRSGAMLSPHHYHVRALDWSPDGSRLATSGDAMLRIWNRQGVLMSETKESNKGNLALDWSPDGSAIAVVSLDGTARVYSPEGKKQTEVKLPQPAKDVAWGPDSQTFVTMSDSEVQIWNRDGTPGLALRNAPRSLVAMDWNSPRDEIAVGGWTHQFQSWNAEGEPGPSEKISQSILDLAFSPNGERVAMACFNNRLVFAKADGSAAKNIDAHAGPLTSVAWHPNGDTLVSSALDNTLRFWNTKTHEPMHTVLFFHDGTSATLTPAGQLQHGDVSLLETQLVYLIETESGERKILTPSEFEDRLTQRIPTTDKNLPKTKTTESPKG